MNELYFPLSECVWKEGYEKGTTCEKEETSGCHVAEVPASPALAPPLKFFWGIRILVRSSAW